MRETVARGGETKPQSLLDNCPMWPPKTRGDFPINVTKTYSLGDGAVGEVGPAEKSIQETDRHE